VKRADVPSGLAQLRAETAPIPCPVCSASAGQACLTRSGIPAAHPHTRRITLARRRKEMNR
jgi:hypothetical protein